MKEKLYKIECDPVCGFLLRSHDKEEILNLTKKHADTKHKEMKITSDQIKTMIKSA